MLELSPLDVDLGDTLDAPSDTEVDLLLFPVLGKDSAPHCAHNTVDGREGTEQEPCGKAECGWEDEEGEVGLCEGKVEGNLGGLANQSFKARLGCYSPSRPSGCGYHQDPPW